MTTKPGRNDPCHCGSGKKYKKCHLALDEQAARTTMAAPVEEEREGSVRSDDSFQTPEDGRMGRRPLKRIGDFFTLAARSGLLKRDPELKRIFKDNETLINYASNVQEIQEATDELEARKEDLDDFRKLFDEPKAFLQRCETLFGEESFTPLRFTAADVERAFQKVGFPLYLGAEDADRKLCVEAVRFLATKEQRNHLSMELMLRLPKYVAQGRYLDARLIEFAALVTVEDPDDINPFLLCMFLLGVGVWEDQRDRQQKVVLQELGCPLGKNASPAEIDAWVAGQFADPAKKARLEELMQTQPGLFHSSTLTLDSLAHQAHKLLERDDAKCLWLSPEEIAPWVPFLLDKVQLMLAEYGPKEGEAKIAVARQEAAFKTFYLPAMREVTKNIFTPERLCKLVSDLRDYRNRLFAAGEKKASFYAESAIQYVEPEEDPSQNVFLVSLCGRSIHGAAAPEEEASSSLSQSSRPPAEEKAER